MIKIKESAPHRDATMPANNYGARHQAIISRASARGLCGMYPLPGMGEERAVALNRFYGNLRVANISGAYVLRASGAPVDQWPEVFGITIIRKEN